MTYARKNLVKEKVARGEIVMGMEMWFRDPRIVELMGHAGFDFLHIENEHVAHNWIEVENLIRTAELAGLTPLYRTEQCFDGQPPVNEIIKALKLGAQIIMVPQVSTPEAAKKVVAAAKYPPLGRRGIATCDRGCREIYPTPDVPLDTQVLTREVNDQVMLWVIIETPEAIKNIDAILAVDGIDAVGLGHQDFAIASGLSDDAGKEVAEAREIVREAAKRAGKLMWWNTDKVDDVKDQVEKGMQMVLFGCDIIHMDNKLRSIIKDVKG